jgi:hypothetical protein
MIKANTMEYSGRKVANFTIANGEKELSLTVDNGAMGAQDTMTRADIRCFSSGKDITGKVFGVFEGDVIRGDVYTMATAMNWLQLSSDPYGGQF